MKKEQLEDIYYSIKNIIADLRYIKLYRKRYDVPQGMGEDYWRAVMRRYGNFEKKLKGSSFRWHVIEYKDGRKELAYLRVLQNGIFSGMASAIYRGILIPHRISFAQFDAMKNIRGAF